ncbi:hypothetical protein EV191_101933 [Tamaricihabitans halophyticus]|uniref:Uncharacterized protein n=1 Tax=Tamaricihabitans halophyticus TaxID=1262583 RepID=A0A4R2R354_9PSEU|nr:hypothetical protein EV191_101933 [Tamaricihabitans halophyticus]
MFGSKTVKTTHRGKGKPGQCIACGRGCNKRSNVCNRGACERRAAWDLALGK